MRAKTIVIAAFLLAFSHVTSAQVTGHRTTDGCVSVAGASSVTAEGRLTLRRFAGPPNYENIAAGDAEERTFILRLPRSACIDDGGEFADPRERFATVHVSPSEEALLAVLSAAIGRHVIVSGQGFAAHTGHHHAPLVVLADRITVR